MGLESFKKRYGEFNLSVVHEPEKGSGSGGDKPEQSKIAQEAVEMPMVSLETEEGRKEMFKSAIVLFTEGYQIRTALGYESPRLGLSKEEVEGNFPLRMQYAKLKKALGEVSRKAKEQGDAALTEDDVQDIQTKFNALVKLRNRVETFARKNGVQLETLIPEDEEDSVNQEIVEPDSLALSDDQPVTSVESDLDLPEDDNADMKHTAEGFEAFQLSETKRLNELSQNVGPEADGENKKSERLVLTPDMRVKDATDDQFVGFSSESEPIEKVELSENEKPEEVLNEMQATLETRASERGYFEKISEIKKDRKGFWSTAKAIGLAALVTFPTMLNNEDMSNPAFSIPKVPTAHASTNDISTPDSGIKHIGNQSVESEQISSINEEGTVIEQTDVITTLDGSMFTSAAEMNTHVSAEGISSTYTAPSEMSPGEQEVSYVFSGAKNAEGKVIDTVSEAAFETWKADHSIAEGLDVSNAQFLAGMWALIADVEKNPNAHTELTKKMGIDSGDIHTVFQGDENGINLQPFFESVTKYI